MSQISLLPEDAAPSYQPLKPFYMWAGGKSRLLGRYSEVWPDLSRFDSYVEPFFGGGAVFGWLVAQPLAPQLASLGDVNAELVGLLEALRDDPDDFLREVRTLVSEYLLLDSKEVRKNWYYDQRKAYWRNPTPSHLYVLMRLGFNGIWQTCKESNGLFGTPAGLLNHSSAEAVYDEGLMRRWAEALKKATLHAGDYSTIPIPEGRALIYLDPPYRASFTNYSTGWSDDDQKRLTDWFKARHAEGHTVLLANRCVEDDTFFEDILGGVADFHYFDVTYTAGRRRRTPDGFEAKPAREFLAISRHTRD